MNLLKLSLYYNIFFLDIKRKLYKFFNPTCTKKDQEMVVFLPLCVVGVCGGEGFRGTPQPPR